MNRHKSQETKYIVELVKQLKEKNICMKNTTQNQLESLYSIAKGQKIPQAYIEFMSVMGNGTEGNFMGGDSCFIDEIFDLKQGAVELLQENESQNKLTEEDFVFWMSQGCMFCFFKLNSGDNPPVFFYNEDGEDKFIKIADSIVEFWMNRFEMSVNLFKAKENK